MTTTYGSAPYCAQKTLPLRCAPRGEIASHALLNICCFASVIVRLLPCARPSGILESAPRTSLRADSADESWDGFWSVADGSYHARCTRSDGSQQWFRIADELIRVREDDARVIVLRPARAEARGARRMLLLQRGKGLGSRNVLVGVFNRKQGDRSRRGEVGARR
jgi:hypothetical protein